MRPLTSIALVTGLGLLAAVCGANEVRVTVTADTSLQAHRAEITYNSGASSTIRIKGNEHFMLADFDLHAVKGWRVDSATLYIHEARETKLRTVGLSTIAAPWQEGTGRSNETAGGCTFTRAVWPDTHWDGPDSDFLHVSLTNGNTLTCYTDVRREDNGWLAINVEPRLVHAMLAGASHGLCLSDEKGQTRANNDVHSREQSAFAPYMIVQGRPEAIAPPSAPEGVSVEQFPTAATYDTGALALRPGSPSEAIYGYEVSVVPEGSDEARRMRFLRPCPGDERPLVLPGLPPDTRITVSIAAFGRSGDLGPGAEVDAASSPARERPAALARVELPVLQGNEPALVNGLRVWACPAECKVSPISGNVLEEVGRGKYEGPATGVWRRRNPVWDGREARLTAARGEVIALQVIVENATGRLRDVALEIIPEDADEPLPEPFLIARNWYVRDGEWYAEYMVPTDDSGARIPAADNRVEGQTNQSFTLLWEMPEDITPGLKRAALRVTSNGTEIVPLVIEVVDVEIPTRTTFEVDLNCYGPVGSVADFDKYLARERRYYSAAHRLRSTLNPLPYSQSGSTYKGFVPPVEGVGAAMRVSDWAQYDAHYGPYLDGSAFEGVRAGVPITHMYLPFHESWPTPIAGNYSAANDIRKYHDNIIHHALVAPPVEQAFSREFQGAFVAVTRQFADHFNERGWTDTDVQAYQNNKYYFKDEKHNFRGTSWWLLDEPMHRDDWLALRFFARMHREGAASAPRFVYRGDISRPQWQRDWLDGLVDVMCVSSALFTEGRHCRRMRDQWGAIFWHYGTANAIHASNLIGVAWALKAYLAGADGILPWNCIGGDGAYEKPTATALFVPGDRFGIDGPVLSLRMLGLCRGQQDVEYLNLLAAKTGYDRDQMSDLVSGFLTLAGTHRQDYTDDAGRLQFDRLNCEDFAALRRSIIAALQTAD